MQILEQLLMSFDRFPERKAFYINDTYYTYGEFYREISRVRALILHNVPEEIKYIGIITRDDLLTYASIFAIWFSGKAYVPLNPDYPSDRLHRIVEQAGLNVLLAGADDINSFWPQFTDALFINNQAECASSGLELPDSFDMKNDCYLLFTSGTTGIPKGVPVTFESLDAFISAFIKLYSLDEEDRFLQVYDLSFDASIPCFVGSLLSGGCLYTVPGNVVKYLAAYKLMLRKELTFVKMPPSTLSYLKPYFKDIRLDKLRYCLLGGEAVSSSLVREWSKCAPNAIIHNCYGPTEITVNSHVFEWKGKAADIKNYNDVMSIGKCIGDNRAVILGPDQEIAGENQMGELCLSGIQLTNGYWKNDELNAKSFISLEIHGDRQRFYRTGDIVFKDDEGDYLFVGRLDSQVQIQGFRVELGEIEKYAREVANNTNVAVLAVQNPNSVNELFLFIEGVGGKAKDVENYLDVRLPSFMIPKHIIYLEVFPKSVGGKINRSELEKIARSVFTV